MCYTTTKTLYFAFFFLGVYTKVALLVAIPSIEILANFENKIYMILERQSKMTFGPGKLAYQNMQIQLTDNISETNRVSISMGDLKVGKNRGGYPFFLC